MKITDILRERMDKKNRILETYESRDIGEIIRRDDGKELIHFFGLSDVESVDSIAGLGRFTRDCGAWRCKTHQ